MQPGRELDALVAEKVMGWFWWDHPSGKVKHFLSAPHPRGIWGGIGEDGFVEYTEGLPRYSTDIAAAWQVVERVTRTPRSPEEAERAANTRFGYWWDAKYLWAYSAPEAAHAICLAALKALGVDVAHDVGEG